MVRRVGLEGVVSALSEDLAEAAGDDLGIAVLEGLGVHGDVVGMDTHVDWGIAVLELSVYH